VTLETSGHRVRKGRKVHKANPVPTQPSLVLLDRRVTKEIPDPLVLRGFKARLDLQDRRATQGILVPKVCPERIRPCRVHRVRKEARDRLDLKVHREFRDRPERIRPYRGLRVFKGFKAFRVPREMLDRKVLLDPRVTRFTSKLLRRVQQTGRRSISDNFRRLPYPPRM